VFGVFYLGFMITFVREPPVGRRLVLKVRAVQAQQEIQDQLLMGPVPGSIIADPTTGKMYRVQSTEANPHAGFKICPSGVPLISNPTPEDLKASTRCRDGGPFNPQDRAAEGIDTPCTAGTVVYLCNPQTGLKMEQLTPSDADYDRSSKNHWQMPQPTWTEPHSWMHLEWAEGIRRFRDCGAEGVGSDR
jgi:hypothetical protein